MHHAELGPVGVTLNRGFKHRGCFGDPPVPADMADIAAELYDQRDEFWRWLLFSKHAAQCGATAAQACEYGERCSTGKKLFKHVNGCRAPTCLVPRCQFVKESLEHYAHCKVRARFGCGAAWPSSSE